MAFTYAGTPAASSREWVRWRVGDTDSTDPLQTDTEVDAAVSVYGSKFKAAAAGAKAIAAKYARKADMTMDQLSIKHSQKSEQYLALAAEIEASIGLDAGRVGSIAISRTDRETERDDTDRPEPAFTSGMFSEVVPLLNLDPSSSGST